MEKLLIVTAPSGAGKTTIVQHLLQQFPNLAFSVSATTRPPRSGETNGKDYYFLTLESFRRKIRENAFVEWEEVYADRYYGTLRSELENLWAIGKDVIFDIDTKGALNLKQTFPEQSLAIFIRPPSYEVLSERLKGRNTEGAEDLRIRLEKASEEMEYQDRFDRTILNDDLNLAVQEAFQVVDQFLNA